MITGCTRLTTENELLQLPRDNAVVLAVFGVFGTLSRSDHNPFMNQNLVRCMAMGAAFLLLQPLAYSEVRVVAERDSSGAAFAFRQVPPPANNDAATAAQFTLVDGERDRNGGSLAVLRDGLAPTDEDQPSANFFFQAGTDGGRIQIDLGRVISVKQINTYSWHPGARGPQVYQLYAADGAANGFTLAPKRGIDPETCGWKRIASVDTRPESGDGGGQYGVTVSDPTATAEAIGQYRYLLFAIARTEDRDAFGNTFYSEFDVIDADGPAPTTAPQPGGAPILTSFDAADGKYHFTIDATSAPDLTEWCDRELKPVIQQWYPKLVALLPSDGFEPPANLTLRFRNDMGGTPASAGGSRINLNSEWFRKELKREARGSVVHEMVHVVQSYGRARRMNPGATRAPGWLVEGIADYIRWFLYEPETEGAAITERNFARAKFDASYRVTGNFLNYLVEHRDKDIVRKLNAAIREGGYSEQLWQEWTGKTVQELGEEWKKALEANLKTAGSDS